MNCIQINDDNIVGRLDSVGHIVNPSQLCHLEDLAVDSEDDQMTRAIRGILTVTDAEK